MFLLAVICFVASFLLAYSMPHGPPPRELDGSIEMTTIYRYDQNAWKVYPAFGLGLAAPLFLVIGCWRLFRQRKERNAQVTTA
jgi:hypothetical protein